MRPLLSHQAQQRAAEEEALRAEFEREELARMDETKVLEAAHAATMRALFEQAAALSNGGGGGGGRGAPMNAFGAPPVGGSVGTGVFGSVPIHSAIAVAAAAASSVQRSNPMPPLAPFIPLPALPFPASMWAAGGPALSHAPLPFAPLPLAFAPALPAPVAPPPVVIHSVAGLTIDASFLPPLWRDQLLARTAAQQRALLSLRAVKPVANSASANAASTTSDADASAHAAGATHAVELPSVGALQRDALVQMMATPELVAALTPQQQLMAQIAVQQVCVGFRWQNGRFVCDPISSSSSRFFLCVCVCISINRCPTR